jgi:hypothetical protein
MSYNYDDNFDMYNDNKEQGKLLTDVKSLDRGYNIIYRTMPNRNGKMKRTKVILYTSGSTYSHIRDAETGVYYNSLVGSSDEDLYFKVILATGECKSRNGSRTLFYLSPRHYINHLNGEIDDNSIAKWQIKHDARVRTKEKSRKKYD